MAKSQTPNLEEAEMIEDEEYTLLRPGEQ